MAIENWIFWLAVAGGLDSLYTALQQKFPKLFEFCFDSSFKRVNCYEILHSKYARLFFVPNSWLGVASYSMLAWIYYAAPNFLVAGAERLYLAGAVIATIGLLVSYYLLNVQAKKLRKWCIFCLISTTLMTLISLLAWISWVFL